MGFTTGFTGGVTLTLSLAYLSVLAHRRNREQQGRSLRAQALAIQSLMDPIPEPLPPTRSEVAAAQRAASVEVAKDKWNEEVQNAVRWVQHTDWDGVREGMEKNLGNMWAKAFGDREEAVKAAAEESAAGVVSASKDAYAKAKRTGEKAEETAESKARLAKIKAEKQAAKLKTEAKERASKAEMEIKDKAAEAPGIIASALGRGRDKAQEVVGMVKNAVGIAEDKMEATIDGATKTNASPIQKALHQRYEKSAKDDRTVAEVLKERYKPMDKQDNTILRGV